MDKRITAKRRKTRKGLLLTFKDAGKRFLQHISNDEFDRILQNEMGLELLKLTELQRIPETDVFNGNRYAVVRIPEKMEKITDTIPIRDTRSDKIYQIQIRFRGKKWFCARCTKEHTEACPVLKAFYEAKDRRKVMEDNGEIAMKIISDSTLRNASSTGLRSDVLCMSGGGIGQVAQATLDDPQTANKNIVIIAGTNDVKEKAYSDTKEYAEVVSKSLEKVLKVADKNTDQKVVIPKLYPYKEKECTFDDPATSARREYLHDKIDELLIDKRSNIDTIPIQYEVDISGHPTINGTKQILEQINDYGYEPPIIWNRDFITHDKIYKGIQSVYKYGCGICEGFGKSITHNRLKNSKVCDDCLLQIKEKSESYDPRREELMDKLSLKRKGMDDEQPDIVKKAKEGGDTNDEEEESEESDVNMEKEDRESGSGTDGTLKIVESKDGYDSSSNDSNSTMES